MIISYIGLKAKDQTEEGQNAEGWIPFIQTEEWSNAPLSLRLQVSIEILNTSISSLNNFIVEQQKNKINSQTNMNNLRLESFTLEEMSQILDKNQLGATSVNVIALSLVNLKRLDLGTENSVRVYKVRRYY